MLKSYKGKIYAILLSISVSVLFISSKLVENVSDVEKIYYRGIINIIIVVFYWKKNKINIVPSDSFTLNILIIRGFLGGISYSSMFIGLYYNTLQVYTIIFSTNSILSIIFSIIFLKEKLNTYIIICFLASFIGILITINPNLFYGNYKFLSNINYIGIISAIVNTLCTSIDRTIIKKYSKLNRKKL